MPRGRVVEIGSLYMAGTERVNDLRRYFSGIEYVGCDIRKGLGVDQIEDAHALTFPADSVGTVLQFEILEHLPDPKQAVSEAYRVLRSDGLLAISVPFNYRLHGFPSDYWRFTASGLHRLLSQFPEKVVFSLGPRLKPSIIFAVAAKSASPEFTLATARFKTAIYENACQTRWHGHLSVFKERLRDFAGHLLGRAELGVHFFDPNASGGYIHGGERKAGTREQGGAS